MKVILVIALALGSIIVTPAALAEDLPAPPSSPPTAAPASPELVRWALGWHRAANRRIAALNRARSCFGMPQVHAYVRPPARSQAASVWYSFGRTRRTAARAYREEFIILRGRMKNPGGSGWERWRPLVRWHWPPRLVDKAIRVIRYESGGNPRILNGGYVLPRSAGDGRHVHRAGGLFQLYPAPEGWANPDRNVWYAYHKKYVPAGGWSPWSGCAAF